VIGFTDRRLVITGATAITLSAPSSLLSGSLARSLRSFALLILAGMALPRAASAFTAPYQSSTLYIVSNGGQSAARVVGSYTARQGNTTVTLPELELYHQFTSGFGVQLVLPWSYVGEPGSYHYGFGSAAIEADIHLYGNASGDGWPSIGIAPRVYSPSPASRYGLGTGYAHYDLPLIVEKDFGHWTAVGNAAWEINPGRGNKDYAFLGTVLSRSITENFSAGAELYYRSAQSAGERGQLGTTIGAKYQISDGQAAYASVGRAINSPDHLNRLTAYLIYEINF